MDNFLKFGMFLVLLFVPVGAFAENYNVFITGINDPACHDDDSCWSDDSLTINQYDIVTWHNDVFASFTVTSGDPLDDEVGESFNSGVILPDRKYSHTFENVGQYNYFSMPQPWITGSIIVIPSEKPIDIPVSKIDEKPTIDPMPKADPMPIINKPPKCGKGTESVNGICVIIKEPELNFFEYLLKMFSNLFG